MTTDMQRTIVACYREFAPHPGLRGRVRALFSFAPGAENAPPLGRVTREVLFGADDAFSAPLFADGSSSIVFQRGMTCGVDGRWRRNPAGARATVIGAIRRAGSDAGGELPALVGAYLHPARLSSFVRASASELTDRIVPLEELWGAAARELSAELGELDEIARIDRLESALLRHTVDRRDSNLALDVPGLAAWILARRGRVTVEQLAHVAGVSRQRLTRVFHERVGVRPKMYCRLARFQAALGYAGSDGDVDWARAATEMGYADQSHMIAEFREFSSLTPQMLARGRWFHPFIERARIRERMLRATSANPWNVIGPSAGEDRASV